MKNMLIGPEILEVEKYAEKIEITDGETVVITKSNEDAKLALDAIVNYFGNNSWDSCYDYYDLNVEENKLYITSPSASSSEKDSKANKYIEEYKEKIKNYVEELNELYLCPKCRNTFSEEEIVTIASKEVDGKETYHCPKCNSQHYERYSSDVNAFHLTIVK
jgi:ribosomal protein L37AE/L43A